jgi:NAD(P)H-dependent nitrite reductase small subunit
MAGHWVRVAAAHELPPGQGRVVRAGEREVALFNVAGTLHAIDNACAHRGGPLGEGALRGAVVACPWHDWRYDVRTGVNVLDDRFRVTSYPVRVEGADVLVEI